VAVFEYVDVLAHQEFVLRNGSLLVQLSVLEVFNLLLYEFSSFLLVLRLDSFVTKLKDFQEIEMLGLQN